MRKRVLKHPILGLAAGAVTGGVLVAAVFTLGYATPYAVESEIFTPDLLDIARFGTACFVFAVLVWTLGLIVVGGPIWQFLENRAVRGPAAAILLGTTAVYLVGMLWLPTQLNDLVGPPRLALAFAGGIVGFMVERVAYQPIRPPRPPAPPS